MLADTPLRCSQLEQGAAAVAQLSLLPTIYSHNHRLSDMPRRKQDKPQHLEEDGDSETTSTVMENQVPIANGSDTLEPSQKCHGNNQRAENGGHLNADQQRNHRRNGE